MSKILVVDDDAGLRNAFRRMLTARNYEVVFAEEGQQALDILAQGGIDLVSTDIQMPGMNGVRLLDEMNKAGYTLPVIVVSSETKINLTYEGPLTRFGKPMVTENYLAAIKKLLQ